MPSSLCKLCLKPLSELKSSGNYPSLVCSLCYRAERMRVRSNNRHRRLRKRAGQEAVHRITVREWFTCLDMHNYSCASCGRKNRKRLTMDHVVSLGQGGKNTIDNIQPLCKACHETKDGHGRKLFGFLRRPYRKFRWLVKSHLGITLPSLFGKHR